MKEPDANRQEKIQLTDTQILTLAISITFPVLGLIGSIAAAIHANKRIDEAIQSSHRRIEDFEKAIDTRFGDLQKAITSKIDNGFEHMELLLKLHEAEHHKN
jgi:hypothetical protein